LVCAAYSLIRAFGGFNDDSVYEDYDMRNTPLQESLWECGGFCSFMIDKDTHDLYLNNVDKKNLVTNVDSEDPESCWDPPISITRGGVTTEYTQRSSFWCGFDPVVDKDLPSFDPNETDLLGIWVQNNGYLFEEIVIMTDGTCGSACSQFISKMQVFNKAIVYSQGGLVGQDMETSGFAGGNVEEWDAFIDGINQLGTCGVGTLDPLPTNAAARFNHREIYMQDDNIPREFIKLPADVHEDDWDFGGIAALVGALNSFPTRPTEAVPSFASVIAFSPLLALVAVLAALLL